MTITTVGEVIKALQQFDPETPCLKGDPAGLLMFEITLTEKALFHVVPCGQVDGVNSYVDAIRSQRIGFDAVVL